MSKPWNNLNYNVYRGAFTWNFASDIWGINSFHLCKKLLKLYIETFQVMYTRIFIIAIIVVRTLNIYLVYQSLLLLMWN